MKVLFAIPALTGTIHIQCMASLMAAQKLLDLKGIEHDVISISNCPYLNVARNSLTAMFMADTDATDLFFIDSDVGFDPQAVLNILERDESIVAGIYPLKREEGGFPVQIRTKDGSPLGRDGLIEAEFLPTGFMRVKRIAFQLLEDHYPELKYESSVVRTDDHSLDNAWNFFGMGVYEMRFTTEDYAFCQRWRDIGGTLWVYPDVNFAHIGSKSYQGNYLTSLLENTRKSDEKTDFVAVPV